MIDRIFVISLKTAHNRRENFIKNNPELVNLPNFEWFHPNVEKEKKLGYGGQRRIFQSHVNIMKIAKERNYKKIIIFEDDAKPIKPWNEIYKVIDILSNETDIDWNYILLGYLPVKMKKTNDDNLLYVNCAYDTHAYMINIGNIDIKDIPVFNEKCKQVDYQLFCNCKTHEDIIKNPFSNLENDNDNKVYGYKDILYIQDTTLDATTQIDQNHFFNFYGNLIGKENSVKTSLYFNTLSFIIIIIILLFLILLLIIFRKMIIFYIILIILLSLGITAAVQKWHSLPPEG
jgi:hypothetical protein